MDTEKKKASVTSHLSPLFLMAFKTMKLFFDQCIWKVYTVWKSFDFHILYILTFNSVTAAKMAHCHVENHFKLSEALN